MLNGRLFLLLTGLSLWSQPTLAQLTDVQTDAAAGDPARPLDLTVTSTRKPRRCGESGPSGEILVCGRDTGEDLRVPGSDDDPESREGQDTGLPRAPDVFGGIDCKRTKCHGFGNVPPPVYVIDVKLLPAPPKGSDAEKVANGEISDR